MAIVKWSAPSGWPTLRGWPQLLEDWEWPETETGSGLNVYETDNEVVVEAPVPGIPKDKIEITAERPPGELADRRTGRCRGETNRRPGG